MSGTKNPCIIDGKCASPTNLPEFIDTSACLCGLLNSKQSDPNGGLSQLWRCIGDASENISVGEHGKWYNTTLPSEELSGINQPQNWGQNGPDLSQVYVLVDMKNGQPTYKKLGDKGSPSLVGADDGCTGKNDTQLSTTFYSHSGSNGTSGGTATLSSSMASTSVSSTAMSTVSSGSTSTVSGSGTTALSTAASSTSPTPSPSTSKTSDATRGSLKVAFLVGILLAPLATLMA